MPPVFLGTVLRVVASAAELPQIAPNASRFVSINLCTDELLVRLADSDKIMAMTDYSCDPNISSIVDQSGPFKKIRGEAEEILALKPDMVFAGPFTHRETLSFLRKMKIPVVFID
ncbi:MAG: ABC transporter substrate-binding protein, partial [Candidatus Omnitrophica bacterium]|nr:ABC transporter substrate-binding protein [Candidatus Omnitrophota bacterium]